MENQSSVIKQSETEKRGKQTTGKN